jgi:glutamate racemase
MIGVCDSGEGGKVAVEELRALAPLADVCFFADRENAPYGTKSPDELLSLLRADIRRLRGAGADEVLIACCTASTVFDRLTPKEREGVFPIIAPTASAALKATRCASIGVLATDATVRSGAFRREILRHMPTARVTEIAVQRFVDYVEGGRVDRDDLKRTLEILKRESIDTLILGCTHFPRLSGIISEYADNITLISSAREGALEITRHATLDGVGATIYL